MGALTLLDTLLEPGKISPVFQPIFEVQSTEHRLHSLECLVRGPRGTSLERADILFAYVRRKRAEIAVDRACARVVFRTAATLPGQPRFSFNVHASTLARDLGFPGYLKELAEYHGIDARRITVEMVEHTPFWDVTGVRRAIDELRAHQMRLAVDDVGAGHSNYNMILDCRPDAFKVDAYLVRGCHSDHHRQAVLESIGVLADRFGAQVIAEGVEFDTDLEALLRLGIHYVQGYLLARPMTAPALIESGLLAAGPAAPAPPPPPQEHWLYHEELARIQA
jgi:EAL domain-containing protein (putative c-di-GMP-specific phosphodiesterase class I)